MAEGDLVAASLAMSHQLQDQAPEEVAPTDQQHTNFLVVYGCEEFGLSCS